MLEGEDRLHTVGKESSGKVPDLTRSTGSALSKGTRAPRHTTETMSNLSRQIKQLLSQPDRDASRIKTLDHLNANHAFSQPTSALADAVQNMRHERDTLRVSVRFSSML